MERPALDDRLLAYREELEEAERVVEQLREDERLIVIRIRERLLQGVVPRLVNELGERLEAHVGAQNTAMQSVLANIDGGLTDGKEQLTEMAELRATLLTAAGELAERPLMDEQAGAVTVNGVAGTETLEGFQNSTEEVISEINELRQKPDELMSLVEEKLSSVAERYCSLLEKEVEGRRVRRSMELKAKVQEARHQLDQAAFLLDKMEGLQVQLEAWLNTQD